MERRTSKNEVRVLKFGARKGKIENEALAVDQIWLQNVYRNALVQVDREFRHRYNEIVSVGNPALDRMRKLSARRKELWAAIKVQRTGVQRTGWKAIALEEKAEVEAINKEYKELKPETDRVKQLNKAKYKPKIKALNQEFYAAIKAVRKRFSDGNYSYQDKNGIHHDLAGKKLFWMNEEHVYNNFLKDRDAAMRDKVVLNFHRSEPEGVVSCRPRLQAVENSGRPMTVLLKASGVKTQRVSMPPREVAAFLAANPGAKLAHADTKRFERLSAGEMGKTQKVQRNITADQAFDPNNGSAFYFTVENANSEKNSKRGKRLMRAYVHIQIGINPKTFFTLPVMLHRPFPQGTVFKSIAAKRERVGRHYRWSLLVTVDYPAPEPKHGKGIVALDPGWAMGTLPDADKRLRVGGLTDEAGKFTELALPPEFMCQIEQVARLQSIIAKETNAIMPKAQEWLDNYRNSSELCTHLQNAVLAHTNAKRHHRETGGFRHLIKAAGVVWPAILRPETHREAAKLDDLEFEKRLGDWYKKFRHLDEWMRNLQDQNDASKLDIYRNWAAESARKYHTIVIDDVDLSKAAKAPDAEKDKAQPAGGQRQMAAPSLLVGAFANAFNAVGGEVRWVRGRTSKTCSKCEHINPPLCASRQFKCEQCGYAVDREFNAGRNLIKMHQAGHSSSKRQSIKVRKPTPVSSNPEVFEKLVAGVEATPVESIK